MAKRWYVVHVYSGFEKKIAEQVKEQAARKGLADMVDDVLVPSEDVVELKRGQKVQAERKFFPGYVLVKMEMTDETWHLIKDTPKVTGFIGDQKPREVAPPQIDELRKSIVEGAVKPKPRVSFEAGDEIRVIDGAFANFSGTVEEVKPDKQKLRVKVSIFGRATPVELDFAQVEKRV